MTLVRLRPRSPVVAPRGIVADLVDIAVYNKNGSGTLRRGYRYDGDSRVTSVSPLAGPLAGGTSVSLTGSGFTGATSVRFGAVEGTAVTVGDDAHLTVVTPAGAALGAVDVTVTTPREAWTVRGGFSYIDPAGGSGWALSSSPTSARPPGATPSPWWARSSTLPAWPSPSVVSPSPSVRSPSAPRRSLCPPAVRSRARSTWAPAPVASPRPWRRDSPTGLRSPASPPPADPPSVAPRPP